MVKRLSAMQETRVQSLGWEDPLEKEMAAHSSIIAWKISWTAEPGRLPSMGSQRHDWATSRSLSQQCYKLCQGYFLLLFTVPTWLVGLLFSCVPHWAWWGGLKESWKEMSRDKRTIHVNDPVGQTSILILQENKTCLFAFENTVSKILKILFVL